MRRKLKPKEQRVLTALSFNPEAVKLVEGEWMLAGEVVSRAIHSLHIRHRIVPDHISLKDEAKYSRGSDLRMNYGWRVRTRRRRYGP